MDNTLTLSRKVTTSKVISVIETGKSTFHITSYFDDSTKFADLLFSAANTELSKHPLAKYPLAPKIPFSKNNISDDDFCCHIMYNEGEG